jgi:hypothetical protein
MLAKIKEDGPQPHLTQEVVEDFVEHNPRLALIMAYMCGIIQKSGIDDELRQIGKYTKSTEIPYLNDEDAKRIAKKIYYLDLF